MKPIFVLLLHVVGVSVLLAGDTKLSRCYQGARRLEPGWLGDASYVFAAFAAIFVTVRLFYSVYGSESGFLPLGEPGDEAQGYSLCPDCGARPSQRFRHCIKSGRCVNKFDHWCPNLGTTIADANHRGFWGYLGLEAFTITWACWLALVPSWRCLPPYSSAAYEACWKQQPWQTAALMAITPGLAAAANLFWSLFAFHTFLVVTGQTTWELLRGPYVPYLGPYFATYHNRLPPVMMRMSSLYKGILRYVYRCPPPAPFNQGALQNFKVFLFARKPYDYQARYPPDMPTQDSA